MMGPNYRVVALMLALASAAEAGVVRGNVQFSAATRRLVTNPADAVVYIDALPPPVLRRHLARPTRRTMIQDGRRFLPAVVVAHPGAEMRFVNRGQEYHSVFSVSSPGRFDLGKRPPGGTGRTTLTDSGVVNLFCDIHPGEAGWVLSLAHRLYTRPDARGRFRLPALPAGKYTVCVWHPAVGVARRQVEVPRSGDAIVALSL